MRWSPALSFFFLAAVVFAVVLADGVEADMKKRDLLPAVQAPASATPSESGDTEPSQSPTSDPSSTDSDSSSESPTPTPTDDPTSSSSSSSEEPQPTNTEPSSSETPPSTEPSPSPTPSDSSSDSSSSSQPSKTDEPSQTQPSTTSFAIVTQSVTVSDGSVQQTTFSTPVTAPQETTSPGLNQGESDSGSSGLSTQNRNIIIGVVVGVGGAIILGGVAFVMWRLRRKRNARGPSDEDDLMNAGTAVGSSSHETSSRGGPSPFKSTLDQYHNPGPVNPSSNF